MELVPGSGGVGWCYVCISLDYLCRWQVQVFVHCSWRIPAHLFLKRRFIEINKNYIQDSID